MKYNKVYYRSPMGMNGKQQHLNHIIGVEGGSLSSADAYTFFLYAWLKEHSDEVASTWDVMLWLEEHRIPSVAASSAGFKQSAWLKAPPPQDSTEDTYKMK